MANLAIIPARGGSKRILKKNIKHFNGKPIIAYAIETALASGLFDEIMVSTDDTSIAEIATQYGANVPFLRSAENANDFASTADVLLEVIQEYQGRGITFEYSCCLYPTSPLLKKESLLSAFLKLKKEQLDCVFPIVAYSYPVQRSLILKENNLVAMREPDYFNSRSQDLEPIFHDAGQFYFFAIDKFVKNKKLWTENTGAIVITELEAQDIDNESDWTIAEMKYKLSN